MNKHEEIIKLIKTVREAVANYMYSEGCSCCRDRVAHEAHTKELAKLLKVKMYPDKSGYDFSRYRTKTT